MAKEKQNTKTEAGVHPNKIGIKEGMGYMLGDAGNLFVLTYVSSFLKVFYTDVLKIPLNKVANLFLITRLWDAINDPMWGAIVAKRKPGKDGKYRPYVKNLAIPLAISQLICFINVGSYEYHQQLQDGRAWLILAFAYVTYIAFGMLYTGMNVPFGSLASVITDDPDGRTLLSTFRSIGGGIGGAAPLLLAQFIIYKASLDSNGQKMLDENGKTIKVADPNGMLIFAFAMAVCAIVFYFACYKTTKERVPSPENPHVDMKKAYMGMIKSRPFVVLALTGILISGQLQFGSLNQYLYKNYFVNTNLSMIGTIAQYLPMALMIPFVPKLVKKYGKKELSGFGAFFSALAAIACFVLKPGPNQAWLFMILLFVIGFGYSFVSITNWAVVADVIDYQEYKTGIKSESAVYAVYTFSRKLGQTLADYGGIMLLSLIGYDDSMANAGFVSAVKGKIAGLGVSDGILLVCTVIPAITYTLIFLLYKFAYPLTKEKLVPIYETVRKNNEETAEAIGK